MAELVARGLDPEDGWRRTLSAGPVTLGRTPGAGVEWAAPWDRQISALHAVLTWDGKRLAVRRLPRGRNPLFFRGAPKDEFAVGVGETFAIGSTTFTVEDEASKAAPAPKGEIELTCTAEELRSMKFLDAEERIDVLAALPELIRLSLSEEQLERQVLKVLLGGIPHADAAAVVRALPRMGGEPEVDVRASEVRDGAPVRIQANHRLVCEAVGPQGQGVLHRWDPASGALDLTPTEAFDWALCVPLATSACPGWGLYVTGSLRNRMERGGPSSRPLLRGDLKFAQMAADIFSSLRQVLELKAVQESLVLAKKIQASFFPCVPHQPDGYEVAGISRSADATGGDYFDVLPLPSGKMGLVVADVTGHGLGPSLLMASVRSLLRAGALREPTPEALVHDLNEAQYPDLHPLGKFVTLLYGTLCPTRHQFCFANAGHGPVAMHLQSGRDRCYLLTDDENRGLPLGLLREPYRPCDPITLEPGDLIILGSDGLVETVRDDERYGMERLTNFIAQRKEQPLAQLIDAVIEDTLAFHERPNPDDDLTLLMVRRK